MLPRSTRNVGLEMVHMLNLEQDQSEIWEKQLYWKHKTRNFFLINFILEQYKQKGEVM